ncbi:33 kDa ribonucleoprotein, chloroplastic isoform X1 [Coffea arabica]|uniref:33 kDa ribonucleoprotein, chloroplastic isoform X1 n=1 Tax=Coffea arabica TaxID=13443 RepID=A0A6P6SMX8_COFAR|nr:33 kDa ribonucleoprotein, chloroplastic-like isoform X1 [Coffea arabica]XP_027067226.1 33 kDa ribonucleoprotein, chloroplastic-like isoform X2 [Coffea arabica]
MSASSLSVAVATAIANSSSSSIPSSSSSLEHLSLSTIHFPFKPTKPINFCRVNHLLNSAPVPQVSRSLLVCASTAFDAFDAIQSTQVLEEEEQEEEEAEAEEIQDVEDENDGDTAAVSLSTEGRRLYVGNLPYAMTSSQLADIFAEAGRVASVEIVYDRVTDRSRGFAFVTMGSFEEAKEAIRLFDGSQVGGRTAKVNFPEVPRGGEREVMESKIRSSNQGFVDSPHKIYAGNLSWGLTSQGLREAVQDQPGFLSAKVVYDRDTGRSRGFGFISFASAEEVDSALEAMNGVEVEGRPLRLNLAQQRSFISPPPAPETNSEPDS